MVSQVQAWDCKSKYWIASSTVECLTGSVPHDVGGIVFLSGGQSDEEATDHLNRMNAMDVEHPWQLSYSYGRALQASALKAWLGKTENTKLAQDALLLCASLNSAACDAKYKGEPA